MKIEIEVPDRLVPFLKRAAREMGLSVEAYCAGEFGRGAMCTLEGAGCPEFPQADGPTGYDAFREALGVSRSGFGDWQDVAEKVFREAQAQLAETDQVIAAAEQPDRPVEVSLSPDVIATTARRIADRLRQPAPV